MRIKSVLLWVLSVFLLLVSLGGFSNHIISGILLLLSAIGCNPLFLKQLEKMGNKPKKRILIPAIVILFFAGILSMPSKEADSGNQVAQVSSEQTTEIDSRAIEKKSQEQSESEISKTSLMMEQPVEQDIQPDISELIVHYIDVGQGDATFITCNNEGMLIDTGNNEQSTNIQNYLQGQGITTLKYLIGTQPDVDHIGGMKTVLNKFDSQTIMLPDKLDVTDYKEVMEAMNNKGYQNTLPVIGDTYSLGDATFTILSPTKSYSDSHNNSLVILLKHGENKFIFASDAGVEAEEDILNSKSDISADVLKVGQHGSDTSTSKELVEKVKPKYALISAGSENTYGYPTQQTLNRLNDVGTQIFRTDEQGTILATSDGKEITWSCEPSTTMAAGIKPEVKEVVVSETSENTNSVSNNTSVASSSSSGTKTQTTTVVEPEAEVEDTTNQTSIEVHITKTGKKYHSAGCQYLRQSDIITTLDNAKAKGLGPCSKCSPPQ